MEKKDSIKQKIVTSVYYDLISLFHLKIHATTTKIRHIQDLNDK
jgi:hypothetical protein